MTKFTIKQIFSVLTTHLIITLVYFFFLVALLSFVSKVQWLCHMISVFALALYIYTMFTSAYVQAEYDNKSHTPGTPYAVKGLVLSSGTALMIIITFLLYTFAWYFSPSVQEASYLKIIANLVYSFSTSFMWQYMGIKGSQANTWAQVISPLIPVIACTAGYYVGYKKIDFMDKFNKKFVYENKNKKDV